MQRRRFLAALATAQLAEGTLPPVRQLTRGPKFHWFGYYDKLEFDPANRLVLSMEVGDAAKIPCPGGYSKGAGFSTRPNSMPVNGAATRIPALVRTAGRL